MIRINELSKKYNDRIIFENVSCLLDDHHIYSLVGGNGIGKSTLLNAITQPYCIDTGIIEIDHIDNRKFESKFHFFYVPDNKDMFLNLTGREYLRFVAKLYRQTSKKSSEKLQKLLCAFHFGQSFDEYIGNYSLGMKQKIYLMAAFLSGAGNLILDEPFNGLDPECIAILKQILIEHRNAGNLVLFSIHNLDLVANFCDDVIFIDKQRNISQFRNPKDFKQLETLFFQKCV
ncbi:MAG: ABC transporter ATP-binding protein [Lachnospiraceae bacterium]|nr:ABC transporter ATP-binding protein [Lachnospiraceae bacterium]